MRHTAGSKVGGSSFSQSVWSGCVFEASGRDGIIHGEAASGGMPSFSAVSVRKARASGAHYKQATNQRKNEFDVDIAARRIGVRANFMGLVDQRLSLIASQFGQADFQLHCQRKSRRCRSGPIPTVASTCVPTRRIFSSPAM